MARSADRPSRSTEYLDRAPAATSFWQAARQSDDAGNHFLPDLRPHRAQNPAEHPADAVAARLAAAIILEQHDSAQFDLARRLLERAIAKDPGSADGYYRMGVLDQEQGKWSDSVTMLKRGAALRPESSKTHLRLAVAYFHLEQKEQAHREAALQKQFRQSEDADMEARRKELTTFILEMR